MWLKLNNICLSFSLSLINNLIGVSTNEETFCTFVKSITKSTSKCLFETVWKSLGLTGFNNCVQALLALEISVFKVQKYEFR